MANLKTISRKIQNPRNPLFPAIAIHGFNDANKNPSKNKKELQDVNIAGLNPAILVPIKQAQIKQQTQQAANKQAQTVVTDTQEQSKTSTIKRMQQANLQSAINDRDTISSSFIARANQDKAVKAKSIPSRAGDVKSGFSWTKFVGGSKDITKDNTTSFVEAITSKQAIRIAA